MKKTKHHIKSRLQPTNNTCGYTALSILLSHYKKDIAPEMLVNDVPQPQGEDGVIQGSVTAQLVDWCQDNGFKAHMYTSDVYIVDLSWKDMNSEQIAERLKAVAPSRDIAAVGGRHWTQVYIDAYLSMLKKGAKLTITPFIKKELLYKLLESAPVFANIGSTASSGTGRTTNPGLREKENDDINGDVSTHSVVIYGNDVEGNFLIADPWDGLMQVDPEHMVLSIQAAQIECDNQIFVIESK